MFNRRCWSWAALCILLAAKPTWADLRSFDRLAFNRDKLQGTVVLLDFNASWCPICRVQKPALEAVLDEKPFKGVTAYLVDYDKSLVLRKELKVAQQSTLIIFRGRQEIGRVTGITRKADIRTHLLEVLKSQGEDAESPE